jgi:hypothetical protein|tara:strand:- start:215 stop:418 length:204 start_codon:yes stop_codon:yes gene_type:complete
MEELHGMTEYDSRMIVAEDLMTLIIGKEITFGRSEDQGTDIFYRSRCSTGIADTNYRGLCSNDNSNI